jgi:hypothetical protein
MDFLANTNVRYYATATLAHAVDFAQFTIHSRKQGIFPKHAAGKKRTLTAYTGY